MSTKIEDDRKIISFPSKQVPINYALEDPKNWRFLKALESEYFLDDGVNTKSKVKIKKRENGSVKKC